MGRPVLLVLGQLQRKRAASLVVIRGRRRIGKSRLAEEYGKSFARVITLTGLAPRLGITAQEQREDFAAQLGRALGVPKPRADDWGDLFWTLAQSTKKDACSCLGRTRVGDGDSESTFGNRRSAPLPGRSVAIPKRRAKHRTNVLSSRGALVPRVRSRVFRPVRPTRCYVQTNHPSTCPGPSRSRVPLPQGKVVKAADLVADGPFYQRKTTRQAGCQIDYLLQDRYHTLYACEVRFSRQPIGMRVVADMQKKLAALRSPRNTSVRPILIHAGGVTDAVADSEYFAEIIDFAHLARIA